MYQSYGLSEPTRVSMGRKLPLKSLQPERAVSVLASGEASTASPYGEANCLPSFAYGEARGLSPLGDFSL